MNYYQMQCEDANLIYQWVRHLNIFILLDIASQQRFKRNLLKLLFFVTAPSNVSRPDIQIF